MQLGREWRAASGGRRPARCLGVGRASGTKTGGLRQEWAIRHAVAGGRTRVGGRGWVVVGVRAGRSRSPRRHRGGSYDRRAPSPGQLDRPTADHPSTRTRTRLLLQTTLIFLSHPLLIRSPTMPKSTTSPALGSHSPPRWVVSPSPHRSPAQAGAPAIMDRAEVRELAEFELV